MSECKHDFDSNENSNYCANGCGETWALFAIKKLQAELEQERERRKSAEKVIKYIYDWLDPRQTHFLIKIKEHFAKYAKGEGDE